MKTWKLCKFCPRDPRFIANGGTNQKLVTFCNDHNIAPTEIVVIHSSPTETGTAGFIEVMVFTDKEIPKELL